MFDIWFGVGQPSPHTWAPCLIFGLVSSRHIPGCHVWYLVWFAVKYLEDLFDIWFGQLSPLPWVQCLIFAVVSYGRVPGRHV
jgi:hypothetical protein